MTIDTCRHLRTQATRLCRTAADAEDLVQETLLASLQAGRADLPWLHGVMANLAMMQARTAGRRRKREAFAANSQMQVIDEDPPAHDAVVPAWIVQLPPSARQVAVLALHGLSAQEIQALLQIAPAAFRQRLSRIRRGLQALSPALRAEAANHAAAGDPRRSVDLQFGLVRRALKAALRGRGLGTHDLDGHLLVLNISAVPAVIPKRLGGPG